jgi:hypothetical protein
MIVPLQLALKTHTNWECAASFATLGKLVNKFTLPPAALPIGDASLTHVIKLAAHSTTSPTPTALRQSFIMTPYKQQNVTMTPEHIMQTRSIQSILKRVFGFNCFKFSSAYSETGKLLNKPRML